MSICKDTYCDGVLLEETGKEIKNWRSIRPILTLKANIASGDGKSANTAYTFK